MRLKQLKPDPKVASAKARQTSLSAHTSELGRPATLLRLQQTHGNRYVQRMLSAKSNCACGTCCKQTAHPSAAAETVNKGGSVNTPSLASQTKDGGYGQLHDQTHASRPELHTFSTNGEGGTVDPASGATSYTSTCCPLREDEPVSHADKFTVLAMGQLPDLGGTQARYRFDYFGADGSTGDCACRCCAFVQFVKGFFETNGVRRAHTLPGSGLALSPTVNRQDSPILPHTGCQVPSVGGGRLNDTPGVQGLRPTDNVHVHLEFDARTIDTCNGNNIVATRFFTLDITGAHPRTFNVSGDAQ